LAEETFMQLNHVKEWKDQAWTRLYEAALFERNTVKLCTCLWEAQLAILSRQEEIRQNSSADLKEQIALRKALGILADLRMLSGMDQGIQPQRVATNLPRSRARRARNRTALRLSYPH
jgi:hypothetical protein